jgi:hypothetical protein
MTADLHHGDGAAILAGFAPGSIDMIYVDPPFGTGKVWTGKAGAFDDRWQRSASSEAGWSALQKHSPSGAAVLAIVAPKAHRHAYLGAMATLVLASHRALARTGTLLVESHCLFDARLRPRLDTLETEAKPLVRRLERIVAELDAMIRGRR